MLTTLNGFSITSRPAITLRYSYWGGSFTCLGETVSDYMLNLYWETSVIVLVVRNLGRRYFAPISVNFSFV